MSKTISRYFIVTALFFFLVGCIEGIMFPTKFQFQQFFAAMLHVPADQLKTFFGYFVAKIHTHINLVGWVGSALMGILYFIVPQISGVDRTSRWAAWGNWAGNTLGVLLMAAGFHMIGTAGLASGHDPGTPGFRAAAASFKTFVAAGGILITLSTLLFIYNMLASLFASPAEAASERKQSRASGNARAGVAAAALALVVLTATALPRNAAAAFAAPPDRAEVIMVGDRLVDVAHSMGVVPEAMAVRASLWPLSKSLAKASQILGCPNSMFKKKGAPIIAFAGANGIKRVLIEKNDAFCAYVPDLKLEALAPFLEKAGLEIAFVDFNSGLETAVRETAKALGRSDKVEEVLADYNKALAKTRKKMSGKSFAKRVVVLKGIYQSETGKAFVQVEAPGGYADTFLLSVTGSKNVGNLLAGKDAEPAKGHYTIRKLDGLVEAAPDAIVMTGDALAVQKVLSDAIKKNPALAQVPAIKSRAVYSLPAYVDAGIMEYPMVLRRWADVLSE
jgi:hypothetical protein